MFRFLILVLIFQFLSFMTCISTTEYDYLMTRLRFSWQRQQFGNYLTVQRTSRLLGNYPKKERKGSELERKRENERERERESKVVCV